MATQVVSFLFETQSAIRVIMLDGNPWFVAADICAALGCNTEQTRRLDDDEKGLHTVQTLGGNQELSIINESGLYSLILTSRKPEAKKFKKWVTSEVLPAIRETGRYEAPSAATAPPVLPPAAPELVSAGDMQNLTRLVWLTTHWFRQQGSFVRAVWKALRSATGVPSPQRFQVQHIPLLAAEIRRIHLITRALADLIAEAERTAICRILNRGERTEKVLLDIKNALAQANAADLQGINQQLGKWDEQELDAFINRMPAKTCAYPEFEEMGWEG